MHSKTSLIQHDGQAIYRGLPNPFVATRYHSLCVVEDTVPPDFVVTAHAEKDEVMGIRHRTMPVEGVQFHPESFLTTEGPKLLRNFLDESVGNVDVRTKESMVSPRRKGRKERKTT